MSNLSQFIAIASGKKLKRQEFNASGTFAVPAGVNWVWVSMCGGGGGGAGGMAGFPPGESGGGGAGGQTIWRKYANTTPSTNITVTIGAGGAAGVASPAGDRNVVGGGQGGNTSFGVHVALGGGGGSGYGGGTVLNALGIGGSPYPPVQGGEAMIFGGGGYNNSAGGNGFITAATPPNGASGASGGCTYWGNGGGVGTREPQNLDGINRYGGGGGGGGRSATNAPFVYAGQAGANGYCLVEWIGD